jgi:hypothetical protein
VYQYYLDPLKYTLYCIKYNHYLRDRHILYNWGSCIFYRYFVNLNNNYLYIFCNLGNRILCNPNYLTIIFPWYKYYKFYLILNPHFHYILYTLRENYYTSSNINYIFHISSYKYHHNSLKDKYLDKVPKMKIPFQNIINNKTGPNLDSFCNVYHK